MTIHTEMTSENFGATERKKSTSFPDPPSTSYQLSLVIFFLSSLVDVVLLFDCLHSR